MGSRVGRIERCGVLALKAGVVERDRLPTGRLQSQYKVMETIIGRHSALLETSVSRLLYLDIHSLTVAHRCPITSELWSGLIQATLELCPATCHNVDVMASRTAIFSAGQQ